MRTPGSMVVIELSFIHTSFLQSEGSFQTGRNEQSLLRCTKLPVAVHKSVIDGPFVGHYWSTRELRYLTEQGHATRLSVFGRTNGVQNRAYYLSIRLTGFCFCSPENVYFVHQPWLPS
jgi:hypothetical protein